MYGRLDYSPLVDFWPKWPKIYKQKLNYIDENRTYANNLQDIYTVLGILDPLFVTKKDAQSNMDTYKKRLKVLKAVVSIVRQENLLQCMTKAPKSSN